LFRKRIAALLQVSGYVIWFVLTLDLLTLRFQTLRLLSNLLGSRLVVGSLSVSFGNVLAFGLVVWASFLISRFVRFVLDEDVYPRLALPRGTPYAVSTVLNYAILLIGFMIAIAALGIDMTKFTILAGAFGL